MLKLTKVVWEFYSTLREAGWLRMVARSHAVTAKFEELDADIMAAVGLCRLPVVRPIHANMALYRKYLDGMETVRGRARALGVLTVCVCVLTVSPVLFCTLLVSQRRK